MRSASSARIPGWSATTAKEGSAEGTPADWLARKSWDLYRLCLEDRAPADHSSRCSRSCVFLLELAPLELQRRIVNTAVEQRRLFQAIALLCGLYLLVSARAGRS